MKNVLFVASECVPFIKTGGLADVVGSLPKCFNKDEFDVRVIIPKYMCMKEEYKNQLEYITHFYMDLSWRSQYVGVLHMMYEGIHYYFIDNEYYLAGPRPYGNIYEDIEKFAFFSKAALSALPLIGFKPDIVHCHDWQTGLIPVFLKDKFHEGEFFCNMKSIMTIHNLKFQGVWDMKTVKDITGLPSYYFTPDKLEAYGDANYLKGGLVYADAITTVSRTYAEEIKTPFYGEHLDGLLNARAHDLRGIVNGIDYDEYNPETDRYIVKNYNAKNFRKEKVKNKRALQEELGLEKDDKKFMIGIVSRLTLESLRNQIGLVQQDVYLFCGTIRDNIAYGKPEASMEEIVDAAKKANIHDFIMSLPDGYDSYVGERGTRLSGGQKQRISIARVFLKNPPILILDEATSALDNESERWIQKSLEELAKNRTTITIAHRLSTIRGADQILVVADNGIAESGTHEELLKKGGIYAHYCELSEM